MTEAKEKQHRDIRDWLGESDSMRAVVVASAFEENESYAPRTGASLEGAWQQHTRAVEPDVLLSLRALSRVTRNEPHKGLLDALAVAVTTHGDAMAAQLEMTPDQLYSMTFGSFINKYEQSKGSAESEEPSKGKSLVERLNEAYDEDAEREDEEFFRTTKTYYRRRFHAED